MVRRGRRFETVRGLCKSAAYAAFPLKCDLQFFFNQDQSPQSIKALASVFSGFAVAVFIAAFSVQAQRGAAAPAAQPEPQ
jgi:hypothetical protein